MWVPDQRRLRLQPLGVDLNQPPPWDLTAEEAVLGAMLCNESACEAALDILSVDDFYRPDHGRVFDAMLQLRLANEPVDYITVAAKLGGEESDRLSVLQDSCLVAGHIRQYADIVRSTAVRRRVIRAAQEMSAVAYTSVSAEEAVEAAESAVHALEGSRVPDGPKALRELLYDATDRIQQAKDGTRKLGITTHLADLNALITALGPGTFNILAARPGQGKTALACDILRHVAQRERCALFSLEMSREEIVDRLLASEAVVGLTKIRTGDVDPDAVRRIGDAVGGMGGWNMEVDDSVTTMHQVHRRVRRLARRTPLGLVVVDYIQLLTLGRGNPENRQQEVASISRQLKLMAREFKVPVLGLSQLTRPERKYDSQGNRKSAAQKPTLQSLRESGALEQDADLVMFLWRPDEEDPTRVDLTVEKNRSGPVGKVKLLFVPHLVTFKGRAE